MQLKQVVDIAQRHLNGEDVPLSDVLDAFQTFIETNTPLTEKFVYVPSVKYLSQVWEAAEAHNVLISDEDAVRFLDSFTINDGIQEEIDSTFDFQFEQEFRDAPKGSLFVEAVKANDVERVRTMFEGYSKFSREADDFLFGNERKTPIEIAIEHNRKEIVEVLLQYKASVTDEIIGKTTDSEIKKILEDARHKLEGS